MCSSCDNEDHVADIGQRAFLNRPGYHSIGAIASNVSVSMREVNRRDPEKNKWSFAVDGDLRLSDCSKSICLDMSVYDGDAKGVENTLYKLDELARVVNETRELLVTAVKEAREIARRRNKKLEKKKEGKK